MKKKFIIPATVILTLTFSTINAQTPLPYFTGFDNTAQQSGWTVSAPGMFYFDSISAYSPKFKFCISSSYTLFQQAVLYEWFVSPMFDFSAGGTIDSIRNAFSGSGVPVMVSDKVAIYLLVGSPDPVLATSKTMLLNYTGTNYHNDGIWYVTKNINIPATTGNCYIAFEVFMMNTDIVLRFDNLAVSAGSPTGINPMTTINNDVLLYPNPTSGKFELRSERVELNSIEIYNVLGEEIYSLSAINPQPLTISHQPLTIDLSSHPNGIYFINIKTDKEHITQKLVINH